MVEFGKTTLSSQFVQVPDTPTNFHHPSTSRSTKLTKSLNPSPQLPKRERIQYGYVNHVSVTFAYSIHQASSRFLHSKCFPRFLFPSSSPLCPRIQFESKMEHLRHKILLYISSFIKIRSPIRKIKIPQFSRFPRIPVSLSNSPQCHRIWLEFKIRALKH